MLRRSFSTRRDTFNVLEIFKGITEGNQGSLARAITMGTDGHMYYYYTYSTKIT